MAKERLRPHATSGKNQRGHSRRLANIFKHRGRQYAGSHRRAGLYAELDMGAHLCGRKKVNEDFFTSDITALFTNSSCGIFPTIAASYPIANYPFSGLTLYFDVTHGGWTFKNSIYNGMGYNGWKHNDNPFRLNPKQDGIFNISQLEYAYHDAHYFGGWPCTHANIR